MKVTAILLVAVMLMSFTVVAAQDKVEFSGTWIMNADKSEIPEMGGRGSRGGGGRRGGGASDMIVKVEGNKMSVETTRKDRDGADMTTVMKYTLDGKQCANESGRGESVSTAKWSKDGKSLVIYTETYISFGDREMTIESEATWMFDKEMLKVKTVRTTQRGEMETTIAYDKKK